MPDFLRLIWDSVSMAGTSASQTTRERKSLVMINRAWLILMIVQCISVTSHIINGLQRSAWLTFMLVVGLVGVHVLIRLKYINAAKMAAIFVINYSAFAMGVFLGFRTQLIDLLMLSSMMPLYLFETRQRKLIFWGIAMGVVPFAFYHLTIQYLNQYALPEADQLSIYKVTTPIKFLCLVTLLYLIYHKNAAYEEEVKEKEEKLIQQKKLYELMLEQIPIDIVTFDKQLRYTYVNSAAVRDSELRQWLLGKTNMDYFRERNLDLKVAVERDRLLHEALGRECPIQLEETYVNRHGDLKHSLKGASPIYDDDKKLLCLIGYSLDITGIKEAEQKLKEYSVQLERKNGDLQHFVNATSHDLKTPLRNIASYLQLLERKNRGKLDEDSLSMIDYTVKSVKQLNQLIGDIYQYSVADRKDTLIESVDLNKILNETLKQLETNLKEKKAEIVYRELPHLRVTTAHISLLFSNLIGNGIKYNASLKPVVTIDWNETESEFIFSISDNGIGIPEEYRNKVFEIFQRLHTSEAYEGTGVGLAICKKIVDNYNGRIWVEGEEGRGSIFYFSLSKAQVAIDGKDINVARVFAIAS